MVWIKRTWPIVALMLVVVLATIAATRASGWSRWSIVFSGILIAFGLLLCMIGPIVLLIILQTTGGFNAHSTFYRERVRVRERSRHVKITAPIVDRQVRFTVYRPDRVKPEIWNTMLAFAYRGGDQEEGAGDIKESFKDVEGQAAESLGPQIQGFASLTTDSRHDIPRGKCLRFVPRVDGLDVNPPERSFLWVEKIHRETFRFRAPERLDGEVVHGRMEVYLGVILIAEIGLTIAVDSSVVAIESDPKAVSHGRPYRRIFVSYSHEDFRIVRRVQEFVLAFGDEFIRDWTHLRAGEIWSKRLQAMISEADVFQLFWSSNSMLSDFVRHEWEYALTLNRPSFIRPVYWEEPMPEKPELGLPPEALRKIHFFKMNLTEPDFDTSRRDDWGDEYQADLGAQTSPLPPGLRSFEDGPESSRLADLQKETFREQVRMFNPRARYNRFARNSCLMLLFVTSIAALAKQTGLITWSWWWVTAPLWANLVVLLYLITTIWNRRVAAMTYMAKHRK